MDIGAGNFPKVLILLLISVLFAVALIPTIITQWTGVNTTNAAGWNFTGAEGARLLWGLAPFILIAGIILSFVGMLIVRSHG